MVFDRTSTKDYYENSECEGGTPCTVRNAARSQQKTDKYCVKCGSTLPLQAEEERPIKEIALYYQRKAFYLPTEASRITGEFTVTNLRISFKPHFFMKPFDISYTQTRGVSDAYTIFLNTYFKVFCLDGKEYVFSLNTMEESRTQGVVGRIRNNLYH